MEIGDWPASAELNQVFRKARELGLETNIAELEAFGFTVVFPDQLRAGDLHERMLQAVMRLCDEADARGSALSQPRGANCDYARILYALISQDPVFAEAVMHPHALTLARYLLGTSCRLFTTAAFVKQGKATPTILHADTQGTPPPLYPYGLVCNVSWILNDYTADNGTLAMVPGSHRYGHHPAAGDQPKSMGGPNAEIGVSVVAPRGSLIVFNGSTWHGTSPKTSDGLRAHVVTAFCRNFMLPAENFDDVSPQLIERYGDDLAALLGRRAWQGYKTEGPRIDGLEALTRANITASA